MVASKFYITKKLQSTFTKSYHKLEGRYSYFGLIGHLGVGWDEALLTQALTFKRLPLMVESVFL